ncbi:MAG TPA: hypothetical protein H9956_11100 [Candidatus Eisenbergiella pullicola]|nr:hypothetical protein [Candidatus Eisenbergiella pullicola]
MTNIEKIKELVKNYQKYADSKFYDYNKKASAIMEKYKPEAALLEIKQNIWPGIAGALWAEKENAKQKISHVCEDIKTDVKKWTLKPVSPNTLELLHSIHDFKVPLTISELRMLETEVSGNLIASKIFSGLAAEYGYNVKTPNVDGLLQELRELKSFAETAVDAYAGHPDKSGTFPGNDLLEPRKINGVNHGEFAIWEKMIAADFVAKNASMQRAAELLEDSKVSLSYSLTEEETNRIKALIDDIVENSTNDKEKKTKMSDLLKSEPDMAAKIDLMGGEVKEAVVQCL